MQNQSNKNNSGKLKLKMNLVKICEWLYIKKTEKITIAYYAYNNIHYGEIIRTN